LQAGFPPHSKTWQEAGQELLRLRATLVSVKPFDVVIVRSLSRFNCDMLFSELYIRQINNASVELASITQDVGQDSTGELVRKILHVFDEHQPRETASMSVGSCARMPLKGSGTVRHLGR
jgi:hypothetical protein